MSQHLVKHDYQCIYVFSYIPLYYCNLYGRHPHHQHLYPRWNEKFQRHHQQVCYGKPKIVVYISFSSHKTVSYEDWYLYSSFIRQLVVKRNFVAPCDSHKKKKFVKMKMVTNIVDKNVEDHVSDIIEDVLQTETK